MTRRFLLPLLALLTTPLGCDDEPDPPLGSQDAARDASGSDGAPDGVINDGPGSDGTDAPADSPGGVEADARADVVPGSTADGGPPGNCETTRTLSGTESLQYAPMAVGDRWTYRGRSRLKIVPGWLNFQQRLEVTGTKSIAGADALVIANSNPTGSPIPTEEYLAVTAAGIVNHGVAPGADSPGTVAAAAPYTELRFPLQVCSSFEQFRMISGGETIVATSVARSLGPTTVSGVTFPEALRVERTVIGERQQDGGAAMVRQISSAVDWYAPGIGRIRREVQLSDREYVFDITGALVGGKGRGVLPGGTLAELDVIPGFLGGSDRPAVVSDGQRFLVVASTSKSYYEGGLSAILVGPDGRTMKITPVAEGGRVPTSPAAAFGDGQFLVVYPTWNSSLKAVRLAADGTQQGAAFDIWGTGSVAVAHGHGKFLVASRHEQSIGISVVNATGQVTAEIKPYPGPAQLSPTLSFDGSNFLLAWLTPSGQNVHVSAGRLNGDGNAIDTKVTDVASAQQLPEDLGVAFDGARHVLAWFHRANSSDIGRGEIRIARIDVAGILLDPGGRVIAPMRPDTDKRHPRISRLGSQAMVVWERFNYLDRGQPTWIAGTRVDGDGNAVDSSDTEDGLFLSRQPTNQPIMPAIGWGGDRALMVFIDRSGEMRGKRKLDATVIHPW